MLDTPRTDPDEPNSSIRLLPWVFDGEALIGPGMKDARDCEMAAKLTTVAVTCHPYTGEEAKNWDFDALAGAGAFRSTANDMLRNLKASQHGRRWIAD